MTDLEHDDRLVRLALVATVLLTAILTVTPYPVGVFQDDAIYTVLAKSLATGQGYRLLNLPGEPNATHYPPGYPIVLAALWRLWPRFPDNVVLFKFANAAFLALAALGTYRFARHRLHWTVPGAAAIGLAGTVSIVVLLVTGVVLSEPLFMALLLAVLLFAEQTTERPTTARSLGLGLALGALTLVRTIGIAALPAALLMLAWRRHYRHAALVAAASLILLVPWQLWVRAHAGEVAPVLVGKFGAYTPWLVDGYRAGGLPFLRDVLVRNLQSLDGMFSFAFMPVLAVLPRAIAFVTLVGLGAFGIVILVRSAPVTAWFLIGYLGIALVWPFEPSRFFLGVWPLILMAVATPVRWLWQRDMSAQPVWLKGARMVGLSAAAAITIGFGAYNVRGFRQQWWTSVQKDAGQRAKPIVEWVARNTRPTDVLATDDDLIVYLYADRQAVPTSTFLARERVRPLTRDEDIAAVRAILASYKPRFFITASKQGIASANALTQIDPPQLRPHSSTTTALVYERLPLSR